MFIFCLGFNIGDVFKIECLNDKKEWGPGPICSESKKEIEFIFGTDQFTYCGWEIDSKEKYIFYQDLILRKQNWQCRVEMFPHSKYFVPFFIPVWGIVENTHLHVNAHMNYVFHAVGGHIIAATSYPVQDYFQPAILNSVIKMHGPVKWFRGHYFADFNYWSPLKSSESNWMIIILWSIISIVATVVIFFIGYRYRLKPNIIKNIKTIKQE